MTTNWHSTNARCHGTQDQYRHVTQNPIDMIHGDLWQRPSNLRGFLALDKRRSAIILSTGVPNNGG
ncbi:hypothetical protein [Porphyromonas cangingivalis]|uniref:Uncharacterized protein n=1 Tax=Porphyromonas cangingivalis TaxID=36874 RepID=A0A1T4NCE9_PORCN|nr:hypothetical protein [Porphyromonas cangingivalis]SJZ76929.1 hypothetical protein SAMN02745205_01859 [Porphyromonas cangingivalis]VEJ04784.1 Uncharacterised protein [Porphyromonas cangingivalis]